MSNSQYKRMTGARAWLAAVGLVSASVLLASGPATANAGSVSLPTAPEMLETEQLAVLAEVQTPEEISEVVAEAGPEQWVQLYVDSDTFEYKAAVLLEKPPVPAEAPADQKPSANPEITPYAVSVCGSGVPARAVTTHVAPDRNYNWCGSGSWSGSLGGWYIFTNYTGNWAYAGSNSSSVLSIPAYTVATLERAIPLGYVQLS